MKRIFIIAFCLFLFAPVFKTQAAVNVVSPTVSAIQSLQTAVATLQDQVKALQIIVSSMSTFTGGSTSGPCGQLMNDYQGAQTDYSDAEAAWRAAYNKVSVNKTTVLYGKESKDEHLASIKAKGEQTTQSFLQKIIDAKAKYALVCKL